MSKEKQAANNNPLRKILTGTSISFASGAAAGLADTCVNYPPYCLHYRLQRGENIWVRKAWWPIKELYRGVLPYAAIIPITCITDGVSSYLKQRGVHDDLATFSSGILAAMIVSAPVGNSIVNDLRLKAKQMPAGTLNTLEYVYRNYGLRGFYTGLTPLMMREAVYAWAVFSGKASFQDHFNWNDAQASIAAGSIATLFSQPTDTLATCMQDRRKSIWDCIKMMYAEDGIARFYRGFYFRWYAIIAGVYVMDGVSGFVKQRLNRVIE